MSLFGGLFKGAKGKSSLFSEKNAFRTSSAPPDSAHALSPENAPTSPPIAGGKDSGKKEKKEKKSKSKAGTRQDTVTLTDHLSASAADPSQVSATQKEGKNLTKEKVKKKPTKQTIPDSHNTPNSDPNGMPQSLGNNLREKSGKKSKLSKGKQPAQPNSAPDAAADATGQGDRAGEASVAMEKRRKKDKGKQGGSAEGLGEPASNGPDDVEQSKSKSGNEAGNHKKAKTRSNLSSHLENSQGAPSSSSPASEQHKPKSKSKKREQADASSEEGSSEEEEAEKQGATEPPPKKQKLTDEENEERLRRTLFVGNLPPNIKTKAVKKLFAKYGTVESVRLRSLPLQEGIKVNRKVAVLSGQVASDRGKANAYVVFEGADAVEAALVENMTEVDGHRIRVDRAAAPKGKEGQGAAAVYDPTRSVFVGNLDVTITEDECIQLFSTGELEGKLEAVRVVQDPLTNLGKGFAFVLFKTKAAANAALALDDTPGKNKRPMRVMRVSSRKTASQQQARPTAAGKPVMGQQGGRGSPHSRGSQSGHDRANRGHREQGANAASWQGLVTKGKGKKVRGGRERPEGRGLKMQKGKAPSKGGKRKDGKRPAVAARKAKALGVKGGVSKPQNRPDRAGTAQRGAAGKARGGKTQSRRV